MSRLGYKIFFAVMIPVLLVNLSTTALFGVAHVMGELGNSHSHHVSIFNSGTNDHCPACPGEHHQETEHGHSICEHHSPLYFAYLCLSISYRPSITAHVVTDPFKAFPEVYLDRFIPPEHLV